MATASTRTLLPLDRFFELVSYSPILANQVELLGEYFQPASSCSDPILQYTWQARGGGMPGREEIALAISQAEDQIAQHLKFWPAPKWIVDETVIPPRSDPGGYYLPAYGYGLRGWNLARPYALELLASSKYVIQGGIEAWTLIDDAVAVVYTDADGDTYFETATVTVTTTITDANEIAVYYPGTAHDPAWEIRPIKVTFASGVATITFKRQQAVLQTLLTALNAGAVNGFENANFLTTVDVYRHYNDPSTMAVVEWSPAICDDSACEVSAQTGCFSQIDSRNGIISVHAADWDATDAEWDHVCPTWWRLPTRVRLHMRAGYRDLSKAQPMNNMLLQFEQAIAFLALANMDRVWSTCEPMHNLHERWRTDLSAQTSVPGKSTSFKLSPGQLNNPLGQTRAAVFAWSVIQQYQVGEAVTAS